MLIGIEGHDAAAAPHLSVQAGFLYGMTGQLAAIRLAPVVYLFDETVDEQLMAQPVVIPAEFLCAFKIDEQGGQPVEHIIAVAVHELCRHGVGPGRCPAVILRLVHEEAGHDVAEAHALFVFLMGSFDELLRDGGVHGVDIGFIPALNDGGVFRHAFLGRIHPAAYVVFNNIYAQQVFVCREVCGGFDFQEGGPIGLVLQENAACKAAGPAVFIVTPGFHVQLFRFLNAGLDTVKPFLAQIFGFQTAAGMHKKSVHLEVAHDMNLPAQLLGVELIVPAPEGNAAVFL